MGVGPKFRNFPYQIKVGKLGWYNIVHGAAKVNQSSIKQNKIVKYLSCPP